MASMNSDVATGRRMKGRDGFTAGTSLAFLGRPQLPHLRLALFFGKLPDLFAELALVDARVQFLPALGALLGRHLLEAAFVAARGLVAPALFAPGLVAALAARFLRRRGVAHHHLDHRALAQLVGAVDDHQRAELDAFLD